MVCRSHCCTTVLAVIGLVLLAAGATFPYEYRVNTFDAGKDVGEYKQLLLYGFDRVYCHDLACPDPDGGCCNDSSVKYTSSSFLGGVGTKQLRVLGNITLAAGTLGTFCALLATVAALSRCCCTANKEQELRNKPSGFLVFLNVMAVLLSVGAPVYYALRLPHVIDAENVDWFKSLAGSEQVPYGKTAWGPFSLCFTMLGAVIFLVNTITLVNHRRRCQAHDDSMPLVVNKPGQAYNYVEHIDVQTYA